MPQTFLAPTGQSTSHLTYQFIFDSALKAYEEKTGRDLASDPLLRKFETCDSPDNILSILQQQIPEIYPSQSSDDGLTRWLKPTVNVIHSFSAAIGLVSLTYRIWVTHSESVGMLTFILQIYPPTGLILTAIGVLLSVSFFPFIWGFWADIGP